MASQIANLPSRSSLAVKLDQHDGFPTSPLRHRGLFLVKSDSPKFVARSRDTQAQADSIVAQVKRELARREALHHHQLHEAKFPGVPVYFERETPLVIARRILHSLMGLARIA
jgi:hypothetical protein